jgi:hypothetical protein
MVQVDYRLRYRLMHGLGALVQVVWCRLIGTGLQLSISHSDSVTMVPSFYFYVRAVGRGKDRWL